MRRMAAFTTVALISAGFGTTIIFALQQFTSQQPSTIRTGVIVFVSAVGLLNVSTTLSIPGTIIIPILFWALNLITTKSCAITVKLSPEPWM